MLIGCMRKYFCKVPIKYSPLISSQTETNKIVSGIAISKGKVLAHETRIVNNQLQTTFKNNFLYTKSLKVLSSCMY